MERDLQIQLRKILVGRFSREELRTLCFDLGIPHENLPESLDGLAREMIVYCERHDCVPDLIATARGLRPDIDWDDLVLPITPPARGAAVPFAHASHSGATLDAAGIASATISLLTSRLIQARDGPVIGPSGAAWEKARQLHQAVAARLQEEADDYPAETLKRFEEQPETRKGAIQSVLQEVLDSDPAFRRTLSVLLHEADQAGVGAVFSVNILGGKVGEVINIDRLDGGLTIHNK